MRLVYGEQDFRRREEEDETMERNAMWLFAALFFGSLPLSALMLIITIFSPSEGVGKAGGLFTVLMFTGLLGMVGMNILERFTVLKERGGSGPFVP